MEFAIALEELRKKGFSTWFIGNGFWKIISPHNQKDMVMDINEVIRFERALIK